jgi:hypothetical protein
MGNPLELQTWTRRYRGLRVLHTPVLDREEGKSFQPQTLDLLYAAPTAHVEEEVREAGVSIALASLLLLVATVLLAIWGIRRGLFPLQQLATEAGLITARNWDLRLPRKHARFANCAR